ncbi:hypothetical protein HMPREF1548_02488 [Clostridium sp. KLE 1755]|nr:hypothetical protein HMPREF1548_02488 [Clostridium sp. KLE 1755]
MLTPFFFVIGCVCKTEAHFRTKYLSVFYYVRKNSFYSEKGIVKWDKFV